MASYPAAPAVARSTFAGRLVRHELRATLVLALPLVLTQISQVLVNTTEVVLLGRLGAAPLAAATLAAALFHTALLFGIGTASATAPLIAQAKGAGQPRRIRRTVRQGLWLSLALSAPLMLALWFSRPLLAAMGQDPELLPMTEAYLRWAVWGIPFAVGFIVLRSFTSSFGQTRAVLLSALAAVLLNVPLSFALIFGRFGLPAMGAAGAGLGAAVTYALMFLFLLAYCLRAPPFRRYAILGRFWRPDWATFAEIWRVGLPIGGAVVLEVSLFAMGALLMGLIGTTELAGHQVAIQLASLAFMVPLGVSQAATIRVGLAVGAGDGPGARRAGWVASALSVAFSGIAAVLFWTTGRSLAGLFLDAGTADGAAAMARAVLFLQVAALFQLADGLQVVGIASLRGLKDTTVPMWLAAGGYWGIGLPLCLALGFLTPLAGVGIWIGLAVALAVVAVVMIARFHRLTRRL